MAKRSERSACAVRDMYRVSPVSDTTTERTGSNTWIIALTDSTYGLCKMATLQTTLEGVKGVKHPLILSPRKHPTMHTEHIFTAIGGHQQHDGRPQTSGSRGPTPAPDNRAKERWLGPRDARMRSHIRSQKHLRAMGLLCKKLMDVTPTADYEGLDARCKANRHGIWADELDHRYRSVIVDRKILEDHLNCDKQASGSEMHSFCCGGHVQVEPVPIRYVNLRIGFQG